MAELLRLESARLYGNRNQGCIWSFFHIFDSYQRRETKRLLSYRKMGNTQSGGGTDIHIENNQAGGEVVGDKVTKVIAEQKGSIAKKHSGKARILKYMRKKLSKRPKHKENKSHPSSQWMRTVPIHHSECNHCIGQDPDCETSTNPRSLDYTDSLTNKKLESLVLNGLCESVDGKQGALLVLNSDNNELGNHLIDEHIILKQKLFEARDALLKQRDTDPNSMAVEFSLGSKIFLDTLQLFNTNREALYNVCNGKKISMVNDVQTLGSNKTVSSVNNFGVVSDIEVLPLSHELRNQRGSKTVLNRLRELKQRIKGVIVVNRKVHHRISMDRILDKVPSGHSLVEGKEDQELHPRDRHGFTFEKVVPGYSITKIEPKVQRSRSLAESVDQYSQFFEFVSNKEWTETSGRSKSVREDSGLLQRKQLKCHGRMLSNPELLRSYSYSKDIQREAHLALQSSKKETPATDASDKLNNNLVMLPAVEEIACVNEVKALLSEERTTKTTSHGMKRSINFVEEKSSRKAQENPVEDSSDLIPDKTTPMPVSDPNIQKEYLTVSAESELQLYDEDLNDPHPISEPLKHRTEASVIELYKPAFYDEASMPIADHAHSLPSHIDKKDIAEFTYVKHILSKSGYDALFFETYEQPFKVNTGSEILSDISCEEQLIYDLIHEVLLEIYEFSTAPSSWLPHFHSKIRSMPTGSYLLEEVWTKIRWHMFSPQGFSAAIDDAFARSFAIGDGWMNLYRDAECYGLLLEQLILDDLVDEVILDSDGL